MKMSVLVLFLLLMVGSVASVSPSPNAGSETQSRQERSGGTPTLLLERDTLSPALNGLPRFRLAIQNPGNTDLVLNLGMMLANGKKQYPNAICLVVTDANGKARQFTMIGPGAIGGRLDPFVLPLPTQAALSLSINLKDYWASKSREWEYKFSGSYSIEARYVGEAMPSGSSNLDMRGYELMPYWIGTVASNSLKFDVSAK
jgi:hypothetical protein